ncbi:MAG: signal peptidase I [Deltaproteobacteria bacterium]|nr:signal peptidase I [Candidatus Zymogenaceae bacterium]
MDYRRIKFRGYSMYPALRPGDTLVLKAVEAHNLRPGDIICVPEKGHYVSHRIVGISTTPDGVFLTTKGDNLPAPDATRRLSSGDTYRLFLINRPNRGIIRPRFGRLTALLSTRNLTYGIIKGRMGIIVRRALSSVRFRTPPC